MAKNPFDEDNNWKDTERVEPKQEKDDEGPDEVEVSVADDEDDEDDEPKQSRAEKKRNRFREAQEEAARERSMRMEMESRYQQMLMMQQQQATQTPQEDPYEREIRQTYEEQSQLVDEATALSKLGKEEYDRHHARLQSRAMDIERRRQRAILLQEQERMGMNPTQLAHQAARQGFFMRHADIMGNPKLRMYADGLLRQRWAEGKPDTVETAEEVALEVRQRFGMVSKPPPTKSEKQRYSGVSGGGGGTPGAKVVRLDAATQRMARELYKGMKPEDAYKRYAKQLSGKAKGAK